MEYESDYGCESEDSYKYESDDETTVSSDNISKLIDINIDDEESLIKLDNIKDVVENNNFINSEEKFLLNNIKINSFGIDININQYAWTVHCLKLKYCFYKNCIYDINDNLNITFKYDNKSYKLSVKFENNKELWYPYTAPILTYIGESKIRLNEYLLITNNEILVAHKWNICNDIYEFICNCNNLLSREFEYEFNEIDTIINEMVLLSNIKFSFNTDTNLPCYGENKIFNKLISSYSGKNKSLKYKSSMQSLYENFKKFYQIINSNGSINIDQYINIITVICKQYIIDDLSELEIIVNAHFYNIIIDIIKKINLDIDIKYIESKLNIETKKSKIENDSNKVTLVEDFIYHSFSNQAFEKLNNKFLKRIHAELNNIKETLKEYSIFIIGTEQNMHLFKVLFIPDYDTPYAGGYYEFDLYIPNDYPNTVPKMNFLTTDNGRIRFNPNLYNSGKVCLSLLNTWGEKQWNSEISTISQILISIYSMIFCEHPMTNEPCDYDALKTESGRKRSNDYNNIIRTENVNIAIKKQLNNENTSFKDIIQEHWNMNKEKTIKTIKDWGLEF